MQRKSFLMLLGALALAFGIAFAVAPEKCGDLIGLSTPDSVSALARMMGAAGAFVARVSGAINRFGWLLAFLFLFAAMGCAEA